MSYTENEVIQMKKDEFIGILMSATPQEINSYIERKGKKGKPFCPVVFHNSHNEMEEKDNGKV